MRFSGSLICVGLLLILAFCSLPLDNPGDVQPESNSVSVQQQSDSATPNSLGVPPSDEWGRVDWGGSLMTSEIGYDEKEFLHHYCYDVRHM